MSSIDKKFVMAITGALLLFFVLGHLAGNLIIYLGPSAFNAYAKKLADLGPGLWVMRLGLLTILVLHVGTGMKLAIENARARPLKYTSQSTVQASVSSRTMVQTGLVVLVFIIYHLLHFTVQLFNPEFKELHDASLGSHDVYTMAILGFQNIYVSAAYIGAMIVLTFHLFHATSVVLQTLGLNKPARIKKLKALGHIGATLIFLGFVSIPISVQLGLLKLVEGAR